MTAEPHLGWWGMYIGVDQAANRTGIVVLGEEEGLVLAQRLVDARKYSGAERLKFIYDQLCSDLEFYKPVQAALEGYSFGSVHRGMDLGEVGGVVRLAFQQFGVPFVVVAPKSLKKFVTGSGDADKEMMMKGVKQRWSIDINDDNVCDAYGLARVARALVKGDTTVRTDLEVLKLLKSKSISLSSKPKRRTTPSV